MAVIPGMGKIDPDKIPEPFGQNGLDPFVQTVIEEIVNFIKIKAYGQMVHQALVCSLPGI